MTRKQVSTSARTHRTGSQPVVGRLAVICQQHRDGLAPWLFVGYWVERKGDGIGEKVLGHNNGKPLKAEWTFWRPALHLKRKMELKNRLFSLNTGLGE